MISTQLPGVRALGPPPPPPGMNYTAAVKLSLGSVMIVHTFTALLIPLLLALYYFSTPRSRKQPVFILNVVTILLAFIMGVIVDVRGIRMILSPLDPPPLSINPAIGVIGVAQSILVDTILLLRLFAVYPRTQIGPNRFVAIMVVPVVLKLGRVVNIMVFIKAFADANRDPLTAHIRTALVSKAPYLKIEWFAQLFDNSYASALFLVKLASSSRHQDTQNTSKNPTIGTFAQRLRILFYIASTNFVFPVLFSLAQIIIMYRGVNIVIINDVVLVNTYVAVIGVLFASVWAGSLNWAESSRSTNGTRWSSTGNEDTEMGGETIVFAKPPPSSIELNPRRLNMAKLNPAGSAANAHSMHKERETIGSLGEAI